MEPRHQPQDDFLGDLTIDESLLTALTEEEENDFFRDLMIDETALRALHDTVVKIGSNMYKGKGNQVPSKKASSNLDRHKSNLISNKSNIISFKGTHQIHRLLASDPDYHKLSTGQQNSALQIVVKLLSIAGCIIMAKVTAGASLGVVLSTNILCSSASVALNGVVAGMDWKSIRKDLLQNVVMTMFSFGAGYLAESAGHAVGGFLGLVVKGTLSDKATLVLGTVSGALAGAAVRAGTYYVITKLSGSEITVLAVVIQGVIGAIQGGSAGYLAAEARLASVSEVEAALEENFTEDDVASLDDGDYIVEQPVEADFLSEGGSDLYFREERTSEIDGFINDRNTSPRILKFAEYLERNNGRDPTPAEFASIQNQSPLHIKKVFPSVETLPRGSIEWKDNGNSLKDYFERTFQIPRDQLHFKEYDVAGKVSLIVRKGAFTKEDFFNKLGKPRPEFRVLERVVDRIVREETTGKLFGTTDHYRTFTPLN